MSNRIAFATYYGLSEAAIHRAGRLLEFEIGRCRNGLPVTVADMLEALGVDPKGWAQRLMLMDPMAAVRDLTWMVGRFLIDDEPAPDPGAVARAALIYAGRVVTPRQTHPEIDFCRWLLASVIRLFRR